MKKSIMNLLLCAAALILGVSCSKNAETGKIEPQLEDCSVSADVLGTDTKVALDGTTPKWKDNDQILVLDANKKPLGGTGLFTITSGSETNEGTFSGKKYIGQTPAYAIYPASVYVAATGKFTLPTEQDGTKTTTFKDYAVMMGTVSSGSITFANVCAVLKINTGDYGNGEAAIKSLKVSAATTAIAGEFTPDWTNNTIAPVAGGASLDVTASATSNYASGTDIYLAIFPTSIQALTFEFTNTDDEVATVTDTFAPATNTIKGLGTAGGMEFVAPYTPELLPGVFTVDDAGTKVQFVKGNLYWDGKQFKCEETQYAIPESTSEHLNGFFFSKDATIARTSPYSDPDAADGDVLFAANGGAIKGFTVLTKDQWTYLKSKFAYYSTGPDNVYEYSINSSRCAILKPDNWGSKTIQRTYTAAEWASAENDGLVALPTISADTNYIKYLSCNSNASYCIYVYLYLGAGSGGVNIGDGTRSDYHSIRLVKIVE